MAARLGSRWWHSIPLGEGVVTDGTKAPATMQHEIDALRLPDLVGRSVLDIGAWDGGFSFEAERRRAARVVALDHFIWSVDLEALPHYLGRCAAAGERPEPWPDVPEVWKPEELPGKEGFDVAHEALGSHVEAVAADFHSMDLEPLGRFDVVLYLGVLYHVTDPLGSLTRLFQVTGDLALVETEMLAVPGAEQYGVCEFIDQDDLARDPTNWWVPNAKALVAMLRAAGFSRVELPDVPVPRRPPAAAVHHRVQEAIAGPRRGLTVPYEPMAPVRYRAVTRAYR